jgi:hypothetical protein
MPDLVITLTSAQVDRIRTTFGPTATQADVVAWLKSQLKGKVMDREASIEANNKHDAVAAEIW